MESTINIESILFELEHSYTRDNYNLVCETLENPPNSIQKLEYWLRLKAIKAIANEQSQNLDDTSTVLDDIVKNNSLLLIGIFS